MKPTGNKGAAAQKRAGFGYSETFDPRYKQEFDHHELEEEYDPEPTLSIWDDDLLEDE